MADTSAGAGQGANRVNRGGSWNNDAANCRAANRDNNEPGNRNNNLGFRPAPAPPAPDRMILTGWNRPANPAPQQCGQMKPSRRRTLVGLGIGRKFSAVCGGGSILLLINAQRKLRAHHGAWHRRELLLNEEFHVPMLVA